jgi:Holliday junction DNA helicase RuvB
VLEQYLMRAQKSGNPLPHLLLIGGLGESSLAVATTLARHLWVSLRRISINQVTRPCDMAANLIQLDRSIVFINAVEKLKLNVKEMLCSAMRESYVPITIEEWGVVRDKEIELRPFTVIASTSREDAVIGPLNDQFAIRVYLV